jgi:hypothetical protein
MRGEGFSQPERRSRGHANNMLVFCRLQGSHWFHATGTTGLLAVEGTPGKMLPEAEGMFAAMLFTISIVALSQFAVYYWRAVLAGVASEPVSHRILEAARVQDGRVSAADFDTLVGLHDLTPELDTAQGGLFLVRAYFRLVGVLDTILGTQVPALAAWSQRERNTCARYAAVQVDRRLQANLALVASLRSC